MPVIYPPYNRISRSWIRGIQAVNSSDAPVKLRAKHRWVGGKRCARECGIPIRAVRVSDLRRPGARCHRPARPASLLLVVLTIVQIPKSDSNTMASSVHADKNRKRGAPLSCAECRRSVPSPLDHSLSVRSPVLATSLKLRSVVVVALCGPPPLICRAPQVF